MCSLVVADADRSRRCVARVGDAADEGLGHEQLEPRQLEAVGEQPAAAALDQGILKQSVLVDEPGSDQGVTRRGRATSQAYRARSHTVLFFPVTKPVSIMAIAVELLFTGPDGQLATKAQDLKSHRSGAVRLLMHEPEELRVRRVSEDVHVTALRARLEVRVGGSVVSGTFCYTRVWARERGEPRRVVAGHLSLIVDPD